MFNQSFPKYHLLPQWQTLQTHLLSFNLMMRIPKTMETSGLSMPPTGQRNHLHHLPPRLTSPNCHHLLTLSGWRIWIRIFSFNVCTHWTAHLGVHPNSGFLNVYVDRQNCGTPSLTQTLLPLIRPCDTPNASKTKSHWTTEELHCITECQCFWNYKHLVSVTKDGKYIDTGEFPVSLGAYTTIPKAPHGK